MPQLVPLIAKPSMVNLNDAKLRSTLQPGTVLSAIVSTVNQFGVWVKIKDSVALRGFVHKSNCVDDRNVDFKNHYKPDDKVKVVVLGVNNDDGKITLGLKASLFTKLDKIKKAAGVVDVSEQFTTYLDSIKAVDSDDDDDDEDDNAMGDKPMTKLQEKQHKALEQTASHEQNVLSTLFSPLDTTTTKPVEKSTKKSTKKSAQMDNDDDDEEELIDFDINDDVMATRLNSTIGIKNANNKDSAERKIELLEHALVGLGDQSIMSSISTDQVYTVDQYEIQCAAQPNNAAVWISYMAFQLENNEIQKARDVCKKALKIITVTSLEQRWLIYSSLISIEILYGTVTSLEQSINLAVKEFEKIKVYAEIGRIAISSHKLPLSIEYYQKALRSSGLAQDAASNQTKPRTVLIQVQEIYISLISLLFAQQKRAEAQALLKQSMGQLPTQYTGLIVIKTILLEFQSDHGSVDTGRVMFQMFLKDNSKRVDVWTTWIQQEIKICKQLQQDINKNSTTAVSQAKKNQFKQQKTRIRELFDIFTTKSTNIYNITWKSLKPTQMKLIYSLAIDFENSPMCMGDSRSDVIKNRAQIYVEEVSA
jgi:rRNA biogenesis protein RRP5